jgi:hypothetical protein
MGCTGPSGTGAFEVCGLSTNYALGVPGAFQRFIPTRKTLVLDLDACLLPRDHIGLGKYAITCAPSTQF